MRLLIYALLIALVACTSETESTEDTTGGEPETGTSTGSSEAAPQANPNKVENMTWTFLVDGIFHNNATITAGQSPKDNPNIGAWIDFKDNGTYEYGTWGEKQYDGTWFYDGDQELLDLKPSAEASVNPSQWVVKHKENSLIWIGTPKYSNNATQMRWLRRQEYPTQPAE